MIGGSFHGILGPAERCTHNLRIRLPSKSNICLICHCNKINDILDMEVSGKRKLSTVHIRDIIHQCRILNSVLDVPIEAKNVETLLSPVLSTSLAVLKIHYDEAGVVVSQGLDKITSKMSTYMMEDFLKNLSDQILGKPSFGNLECLLVLFRREECIHSFLKNYGPTLLPKLFQLLRKCIGSIVFKRPAAPCSSTKFPIAGGNENHPSGSYHSEPESLMLVEKLLDVLETSCPSSDTSLVVTDNQNETSKPISCADSEEYFQIFRQYMKEIIEACMELLSLSQSVETLRMAPVHVKVLRFLEKLHHHPETLSYIFSDSTGMTFCSMMKGLLYTYSVEVKTAALSLVNRMLGTYRHAMDGSCADKAIITDFPSVLSQVDLIHFITETMNTSSENLFRLAIQVLDQINCIPLFRQGRMMQVLESTLRISTMRIPNSIADPKTYTSLNRILLNMLTSMENMSIPCGIQRQLMYLFEKLPNEWTASQYLPWIKLLIFCDGEAELQGCLWMIFVSFVQRSKNLGTYCCVTSVKCVLLIAYALKKGKCFPDKNQENNAPRTQIEQNLMKLIYFIMDPNFLPALMVLVRHGRLENAFYVVVLLELLKMYPEQYLQTNSEYNKPEELQTYEVACEEDGLAEKVDGTFYEVEIDQHSTMITDDGFECWTPRILMQMIGAMRLNSDLMVNRELFDLWNENVSRIISNGCTFYLPQLHIVLNVCEGTSESNDENNEPTIKSIVRSLLEGLDIDAECWAEIFDNSETGLCKSIAEKRQSQDVVLAFYFFYALFAGKDLLHFLDSNFVKRFASFLDDCVERYNETQEIQEFGWTSVSFYFRTALMIASCLPRNSLDTTQLCEKYKSLLLEVPEYQLKFKHDVMVYRTDVFVLLFREKIFTAYEQLLDKWLHKDSQSCVSFFTNKCLNEQLDAEINNSLITIAAQGNKETSALAVEFGHKRYKKLKIGFEFTYFMDSMQNLLRQLTFEESSEKSRNSINLSRLSNVMQLGLNDELLFSENHFPSDFLHKLVDITLKNKVEIGRRSLETLFRILKNNVTSKNVRLYLGSHSEFVRFLGSKLHDINKDDPAEFIFVHKILALLIEQKIQPNSSENFSDGVFQPLISWKLSSVLSYLHDIPQLEIWEFIIAIFKVNFSCALIQVEESNSSSELIKSLLNLLFHVQALTHKVTVKTVRDAVWDLLCEFLRFASEQHEILKHSTFQSDVLFQPYMKITVVHLLSGCNHVPSILSLKSLEFLHKWTKMMLVNKLENPSKRSSILEKMVFHQYLGLFKTISSAMKKDRSQVVVVASDDKENQGGSSRTQLWNIPVKFSQIFDIEKKSKLIAQIAKTCDVFLASFQNSD